MHYKIQLLLQNSTKMKIKHLLIVDDSMVSRMKIKKVLSSVTAFEFTEVTSGKECLDRLEKDEFDLVLLDLLMPDIDGIQVLENLKSKSYKKPVLVVSADIQDTTKSKCIELGAFDVVPKSVNLKEMKAKVHEILKD